MDDSIRLFIWVVPNRSEKWLNSRLQGGNDKSRTKWRAKKFETGSKYIAEIDKKSINSKIISANI